MVHAHTCDDCGAVLEVGDLHCDAEEDHAYGLCDRCAGLREEIDGTVDIGGEG